MKFQSGKFVVMVVPFHYQKRKLGYVQCEVPFKVHNSCFKPESYATYLFIDAMNAPSFFSDNR